LSLSSTGKAVPLQNWTGTDGPEIAQVRDEKIAK